MTPGIFGLGPSAPQGQLLKSTVDPWRQQLQQMYGQGVFGSHQGDQAFAGPSAMQAYAMSGQGRHLNPAQSTQMPGEAGFDPGLGSGGFNMGGGISGVIQQLLAQQRFQQQQSGSGGRVQIPVNPSRPTAHGGGIAGLLRGY